MYILESGSLNSSGMRVFHDYLTMNLVFIVCFVVLVIVVSGGHFINMNRRVRNINHGKFLEIVWTIIPGVILMMIGGPSFGLLYSLDNGGGCDLEVRVIGNQWYWVYEMGESGEFESYMVGEDGLELGEFRLLEVDNRVLLPVDSNIRILVSSSDVLHSFAVPGLGVKMDGCPGRINSLDLFITRPGIYYGQCSELCGVNHAFMPICIEGVEVFYVDKMNLGVCLGLVCLFLLDLDLDLVCLCILGGWNNGSDNDNSGGENNTNTDDSDSDDLGDNNINSVGWNNDIDSDFLGENNIGFANIDNTGFASVGTRGSKVGKCKIWLNPELDFNGRFLCSKEDAVIIHRGIVKRGIDLGVSYDSIKERSVLVALDEWSIEIGDESRLLGKRLGRLLDSSVMSPVLRSMLCEALNLLGVSSASFSCILLDAALGKKGGSLAGFNRGFGRVEGAFSVIYYLVYINRDEFECSDNEVREVIDSFLFIKKMSRNFYRKDAKSWIINNSSDNLVGFYKKYNLLGQSKNKD